MRLLLYLATHLSDDHAACLTCWPAMLAHAPLLRTADVLVYAGGPAAAVPAARLSWESIVNALPNRNATIFFSSFNPGYQDGAKYAMHVALTSGWFDAYEWVVRINPDVMVFDESRLTLAMAGLFGPSPGRYEGVFASCRRNKPCYGRGCEHGLIQTGASLAAVPQPLSRAFVTASSLHATARTDAHRSPLCAPRADVLAVRPDVAPRDAFACWRTSLDAECGFMSS